jgi:HAMP domain-containing protein
MHELSWEHGVTRFMGAGLGPGPRRVASSVWLPWTTSALLLLSLAVVALVAGGRLQQGSRVPTEVLEGQQVVASNAAQAIRRNLNDGLNDLTELATALSGPGVVTDRAELRRSLAGLRHRHGRYRSLYVTDPSGTVVVEAGSGRHPGLLPSRTTQPGMTHGVAGAGREVVLWYAPLAGPGEADWVLAGELDLARLRSALDGTQHASMQVVDKRGRVLDPASGTPSYRPAGNQILRRAAARTGGGVGYVRARGDADAGELVAWAPVAGAGPAGSLGLGVISTRPLDAVDPPKTETRNLALAFGVLLLATLLGTFGWLYAMLLRPLRSLGGEAERIAYGDLRHPVEIRRYDEIGLIGHSLERVRLVLLRRIARDEADARHESEDR